MEDALIDIFNEVRECEYKGEHYSVRDNGAILRHPNGERKRPADNKWTFGNKDAKTGYMTAMGVRVHIVVATAFHGANNSSQMVVDHIDTNRCNNRPENLRWLTKLENILLNQYTREKVEYICGSIENFLNNPQLLYGHESENANFAWMRTVSKEEAANTLEHLDMFLHRPTVNVPSGQKMDEWIYQSTERKKANSLKIAMQPLDDNYQKSTERNNTEDAKSMVFPTNRALAAQIGWKPYTNPDFPCCPDKVGNSPLQDYAINLEKGKDFVTANYGKSIVYEYTIYKDKLLVVTQVIEGALPWGVTEITWNGSQFIHKSMGVFFSKDGVMATYTIAQDKEWEGGEPIDFYCR